MANHVWSVLCESFSIDRFTHHASLFDLVETLEVTLEKPFPANAEKSVLHVRMTLVSYWVRQDPDVPERAECRYGLLLPTRRRVSAPEESEIDLETVSRARSFGRIGHLQDGGPGTYVFLVEHRIAGARKWKLGAQVPFWVSILPAEGSSVVTPPKMARRGR